MRIRYTGLAPGQAEEIVCAGVRWRRGDVYDVRAEVADALLERGGWERVTGKRTEGTDGDGEG